MANNDMVCKNKKTALSILETIAGTIKSDTQRTALIAVSEFIRTRFDDIPESNGECEALVLNIETKLRDCLTVEKKKKKAAFYLEGIKAQA
jgi:hypothetical protein